MSKPTWKRSARPDKFDVRDRFFTPNVSIPPKPSLFPAVGLSVKYQEDTSACTGFSLSLVLEHLLRASAREASSISPYMLYSMARRYDEFPGEDESGSSVRGALKGWFKHGACRHELFPKLAMPAPAAKLEDDWWFDAVRRPLGAYYRVKTTALSDLHAALNEVGILCASVGCHDAWNEGSELEPLRQRPRAIEDVWMIPTRVAKDSDGAHAIAIIGYDQRGFLIQNSWGTDWGSYGLAILSYEDWLNNAIDCWVAQLGVVTQDHSEIARSTSLRRKHGRTALASDRVLRNRELAAYLVNVGSDGALSNKGEFRTLPDDVDALVNLQIPRAREQWNIAERDAIDVCVVVDGGLHDEARASDAAARWIPRLHDERIFPIFLMWENDLMGTITRLLDDAIVGMPEGKPATRDRWWNQRLEQAVARAGATRWAEVKRNAAAMSKRREGAEDDAQAGLALLNQRLEPMLASGRVRLHVVAHSAGCIVAAHLLAHLAARGRQVASVSFLAPALRVDGFMELVGPSLRAGKIERYQQISLTEHAEQSDPTCQPYARSLLYLISESLEGGKTAILGIDRHSTGVLDELPNVVSRLAPGRESAASNHMEFDDEASMHRVVEFMRR